MAKLLWLKNERKEELEKTDKWISFCDYVFLKLTGELKTSVSMASGTGIFDIRENIWDKELLEYLKISEENLPEIVETDKDTFKLNEEYSERWEKLKDTKFFLAVGDGAGNNVGAGCVTKEKAALMIGTSGAMRVAFEGEVPDEIPFGLWCYRIDRKRIIIGGALSNGGGLYGWLKKNFRLKKDDDKTEAKIEKRKADQHGITFLPFLAGERSTGYHENAFGSIIGLHSSHDKIDIVQAALEAVAYRFAEIFDQLNKVLEIKQIIASGGALRESPIWTQIICDTLAQNMNLPESREASSRGVVLLASEYVGKIEDITKLEPPEGRRFEFNQKNHKIYKEGRKRHEKFYKLLVQ
jgi:gluconokinase